MAKTSATVDDRHLLLREAVYRYFFYGWLFRDAGGGSALERAMALRHNRAQARWLPLYLVRWFVVGSLLWAMAQAWQAAAVPALDLALALAFVFVAVQLLLTTVYWLLLQAAIARRGD